MADSVPIIYLVSCVLGFLSGLGIGGGSLLILWLTFVVKMPPEDARRLNLLFFLPCAVLSLILRGRQTQIRWKKLLPGILAGCFAAGAFTLVAELLPVETLKKGYGLLLLLTGVRELFYRPRELR